MRFIDYLNQFDRNLTFPWMYTIAARLTGYTVSEIYQSPPKQLAAAQAMDTCFGADFVYPLDDGAVIRETVALQGMDSDCDFLFHTEPFITCMEDLYRYRVPDPYSDLRMSTNLESYHLISESFPKPLAISVPGPITVACELMEISDFARATIRNPQLVDALVAFTTETICRYCQAVTEAGVKLLCISEPTAVILSPKKFDELVAPNLRKIFTGVKKGTFNALHICGNTTSFLPGMLSSGAEGLSLDQVMDMPYVASIVPNDIVLMGNLDPVYVLAELDAAGVRQKTLELLRKMRPYRNFVFSFGCDCLPDTPLENLQTAMSAGRTKFTDLS